MESIVQILKLTTVIAIPSIGLACTVVILISPRGASNNLVSVYRRKITELLKNSAS